MSTLYNIVFYLFFFLIQLCINSDLHYAVQVGVGARNKPWPVSRTMAKAIN